MDLSHGDVAVCKETDYSEFSLYTRVFYGSQVCADVDDVSGVENTVALCVPRGV